MRLLKATVFVGFAIMFYVVAVVGVVIYLIVHAL